MKKKKTKTKMRRRGGGGGRSRRRSREKTKEKKKKNNKTTASRARTKARTLTAASRATSTVTSRLGLDIKFRKMVMMMKETHITHIGHNSSGRRPSFSIRGTCNSKENSAIQTDLIFVYFSELMCLSKLYVLGRQLTINKRRKTTMSKQKTRR